MVVGEDGVEELALDDFRTQFPMAFGEQSQLGGLAHNHFIPWEAEALTHRLHACDAAGEQEKATARLEEVHASTLRHAAAARKQRDSSAAANGPDALDAAADAPQGVDGEAAEGNGADVGPPR